MTTDRKLRVFLCHASQDKPVVRELYQRLLAEGWIDPWLDEEKLLPGHEWDLEIEKAVENADAVIVCISNHSVTKEGYVQKELRSVLDVAEYKPEGAIFIIPILLESCQLPRRLKNYQYQDYFTNTSRAYSRLVYSLETRANVVEVNIAEIKGDIRRQEQERIKKEREEQIRKEAEEQIRIQEEDSLRKKIEDSVRAELEEKIRQESQDKLLSQIKNKAVRKNKDKVLAEFEKFTKKPKLYFFHTAKEAISDTLCYGKTDHGIQIYNQDAISFFEPTDPLELKNRGCLYIIANGVGGAAKGEYASHYAAEKVRYEYYQPYDNPEFPGGLIEPLGYLQAILQRINEDIYEFATQRDTRMATTIVLAVIRNGFLYYANVGNSRAYLIRNGAATQLTNDHSFVGEMVQHGEMTEVEAMVSIIRDRLTRSLGSDSEVMVETYPPFQLIDGDKILLCSDGLTRYATSEQVASMSTVGKPEEIVNRFIKFANASGGADNVTVAVIVYKPNWALTPMYPYHVKKVDWEPDLEDHEPFTEYDNNADSTPSETTNNKAFFIVIGLGGLFLLVSSCLLLAYYFQIKLF